MNKQEIYALLDAQGIAYEVTEHGAVYTMEDLAAVPLPHPEADAKNLFVRDDRRQNFYLLTVRGNKRVDLKRFRREQGTRPLSFASDEELFALLGLTAGSVTPFGLLNDTEHRVMLYLDRELTGGLIGAHPNDNTATVWLKTDDLVTLLRARGCEVRCAEIPVREEGTV
ncbi:MAG TPA: prolyl-tRNA editing protein [Clostridiales bacterium]|nr:prolyl-tRNA editing protein [Clostridiales bacterium]